MGRAGGSGGSRSDGASRHSTGSRSASSSRSSSSLSNRPPRSYSGGGFGSNRGGFSHNPYSPPPPPPPPRPRYRPHFSYDSPTYYNRTPYHTPPLGCSSMAIKIIIASIVVIILLMVLSKTLTSCSRHETHQSSSSFSSSANSTKIWSSSYKTSKNAYFEDNLELQLDKTSKFAENMKMFEAKTGLKPFIFTCEMINGSSVPDDDDFDELAEYVYSKNKFTDTILLIYQESADNWGCWTYMDDSVTEEEFSNDAIDRLSEFIENNYDSSYTNGELFSKAFLYAIEN